MTADDFDRIVTNLARKVRNDTLETAAKVARLYDAPDEAVRRILMLKAEEKEGNAK